jgi:O-antigen/teichoic acid export membrane protein
LEGAITLTPSQKFIANISWTVLGKIFVQVILFAISILLTRYLGKKNLGDYATLLIIPVFMRLLNYFGFETLINAKLPALNISDSSGAEGRYLVSRLLALRFTTTLLFCALIYFCLPYYLDLIHRPEFIEFRWVLIFYFAVITIDSFLSTLLMTLLRFKILVKVEILGAFLNLILLIIFIRLDYGIYGVLYAYITSLVVTSLIYLIVSRGQYLGSTKIPKLDDMKHLAWVSYGITFLSFGLMTQSDILLMNFFKVDIEKIGLYHLATGLTGTMVFLLSGVAPMALSLFSETFSKDGLEKLGKLYCEIVGFSSYLTVPIYIFCIFNSGFLISFIYGSAFEEASLALIVFTVFAGIQTALGNNFTVSTLYVLHKQNKAIRTTVEGSALNIILNIFLIPFFGMLGAVIATGITMVYMVLRQLKIISTQIKIAPVFPVIGQCFLYCLLASTPQLILTWLNLGHLITNLLLYLATLAIIFIWIKPFSHLGSILNQSSSLKNS